MKINPKWETINCADIGYPDIDVVVRINPNGQMVDDYWNALRDVIADSSDEAAEGRYESAVVALVDRVEQGDGDKKTVVVLDSREKLQELRRDNDPYIIAYAIDCLWHLRKTRLDEATKSFRARS